MRAQSSTWPQGPTDVSGNSLRNATETLEPAPTPRPQASNQAHQGLFTGEWPRALLGRGNGDGPPGRRPGTCTETVAAGTGAEPVLALPQPHAVPFLSTLGTGQRSPFRDSSSTSQVSPQRVSEPRDGLSEEPTLCPAPPPGRPLTSRSCMPRGARGKPLHRLPRGRRAGSGWSGLLGKR